MASPAKQPEPVIWNAQQLAEYLGMSVGWVRKRQKEIPRCPGIRRFRVNTRNPEFQQWLRSKIGEFGDAVDSTKATE